MADLVTRLDLYALGRDYVLQRASKIDPVMVDTDGSDVNVFVGSTSVVADVVMKQLAYQSARLLLDSADGEDLDRLAFDRYNQTRKGASAPVGQVRLFRATAAAGAGTIPAGTKLLTLGNIEYVTVNAASFGISTLDGVLANVRAVQAGKATQVGRNSIVKFSKPGTLFDQTLQLTNDVATAGGEDIEDDDTFRNRVRNFWNTARRGILAAIEFGALTVSGVVSAQASEVTLAGLPVRAVNLYIADSSGVANAQLAALVQVALLDYRAAGIPVIISTSIPQLVDVQLALQFRAGVDTVALAATIQATVVEFINDLPVNGPLYLGELYSVLQRFSEDGLINALDAVLAPAGDLVPAIGQTLRTTTANVVVTVAG